MGIAVLGHCRDIDSQAPSIRGGALMLPLASFVLPLVLMGQTSPTLFFAEGFDDTRLTSRGWYDGDRFVLSDDAVAGKHAIQYHFAKGS
jgi:hypothetical protein